MRQILSLTILLIIVLSFMGNAKTISMDITEGGGAIGYTSHYRNFTISFDLTNSSFVPIWGQQFESAKNRSHMLSSIDLVMKNNHTYYVGGIEIIRGIPEYRMFAGRPESNLQSEVGSWQYAGYQNVQSYSSIIDGHTAIVTQGTKSQTRYQCFYWLDDDTQVVVDSWMPWEKGTKSLFDTLRIVEIP